MHLAGEPPPQAESHEGEGGQVGEPCQSGEEGDGGECRGQGLGTAIADDEELDDAVAGAEDGDGGGGRQGAEGGGAGPAGEGCRVLEETRQPEECP